MEQCSNPSAKDLVNVIIEIANRQVNTIIQNADVVLKEYFKAFDISLYDFLEPKYSDLLNIFKKDNLDEYDVLKLLFPKCLLERIGYLMKANVIYTPEEAKNRNPDCELTKATINGKDYYVLSSASWWNMVKNQHRNNFILHIVKLLAITDNKLKPRPLFFEVDDILNIIAAFEKIKGPLELRFD